MAGKPIPKHHKLTHPQPASSGRPQSPRLPESGKGEPAVAVLLLTESSEHSSRLTTKPLSMLPCKGLSLICVALFGMASC